MCVIGSEKRTPAPVASQAPEAPEASQAPEARLDSGLVRGRLVAAPGGGQVQQYLGIPFAKPPVGNLRFADPEPYGSYTDGRGTVFIHRRYRDCVHTQTVGELMSE